MVVLALLAPPGQVVQVVRAVQVVARQGREAPQAPPERLALAVLALVMPALMPQTRAELGQRVSPP